MAHWSEHTIFWHVYPLLDGVFNHVARSFPEQGWFRATPDGRYATFEGHAHLVALDHSRPEVAAYVADVMRYWLDRGADGWRLDAAYAVPASFWRSVLPSVREAHPDAWFLGEMIHGDYAAYATAAGVPGRPGVPAQYACEQAAEGD